jgi:hypothetical protein
MQISLAQIQATLTPPGPVVENSAAEIPTPSNESEAT